MSLLFWQHYNFLLNHCPWDVSIFWLQSWLAGGISSCSLPTWARTTPSFCGRTLSQPVRNCPYLVPPGFHTGTRCGRSRGGSSRLCRHRNPSWVFVAGMRWFFYTCGLKSKYSSTRGFRTFPSHLNIWSSFAWQFWQWAGIVLLLYCLRGVEFCCYYVNLNFIYCFQCSGYFWAVFHVFCLTHRV